MEGNLSEQLRACLAVRAQDSVITCLHRFGPPVDLCGATLLQQALRWNRRWCEYFGNGPHVFVLTLPPGEVFVEILVAALIGGHTVVPMAMPRSGTKSNHLLHAARDCEATALLCPEANVEVSFNQLLPDGDASPVCGIMTAAGRVETSKSAHRQADFADHAPAVIQYTSGSTQMPKGVRIMGEQILANAALVARCWDMNASSVMVNWLPHYHDMGLMGGLLYPLLTGGKSVQMGPLDMIRKPGSWLRAISNYGASFSGGPAFAFAECLRRVSHEECAGLDLSTWTRAYCGAEPIPIGLLPAFNRKFQLYGLPPQAAYGCYGMAEITLYAAGGPEMVGELPESPIGCERLHPCRLTDETRDNLRIVDPTTRQEVPNGHAGEIWLSGESCGQGYVHLAEESKQTFDAVLERGSDKRRWLRTGDLGVVSANWLYITGRLKDILIANGRKVSAAELEWIAASQHDSLNQLAAAAFMPDPMSSGEAVLLIETKTGRTPIDQPEVIRAAIERAIMGEWGLKLKDFKILPRGALERTTSGKIRRQVVAAAYREGRYDVTVTP